jgi:cysteinyl-tRNA synthetase
MSESILGMPIDIHGGGQDLIFPHHENEIAQSEAACGCEMSKFWMHNGFVNTNKEKMSKSLGNFFTIRDILEDIDPEVLRFFLLTTHYRQPLEYADSKLYEAESSLGRIYIFKDELNHAIASNKGKGSIEDINNLKTTFDKDFRGAIEDDFNTPAALAALFDFIRGGNKLLMDKLNEEALNCLKDVSGKVFDNIKSVLFVAFRSSEDWFAANLTIPEGELMVAINERNEARKAKNFKKSDEIRGELGAKGVELIDTPTGTRYRTSRARG